MINDGIVDAFADQNIPRIMGLAGEKLGDHQRMRLNYAIVPDQTRVETTLRTGVCIEVFIDFSGQNVLGPKHILVPFIIIDHVDIIIIFATTAMFMIQMMVMIEGLGATVARYPMHEGLVHDGGPGRWHSLIMLLRMLLMVMVHDIC